MRILFDHNTPVPLLFWLTEHQVVVAHPLLRAASSLMGTPPGHVNLTRIKIAPPPTTTYPPTPATISKFIP